MCKQRVMSQKTVPKERVTVMSKEIVQKERVTVMSKESDNCNVQ